MYKFILFCCFPILMTAQNRIDPDWVAVNQANGFIWAFDIVVDNMGNSYSTGYFRKGLMVDGKSYINPKCDPGMIGGEYTFLMKRNDQGELLWFRYVYGNSRPSKLAIDQNGWINIVGITYGNVLSFTSSTDKKLVLDLKDYNPGSFICKYNPMGEPMYVKYLSETKREMIHDFKIDAFGNYYIAGNYIYYKKDNPGHVQRSFLLEKYNPNLELIWKYKGDDFGNSMISSLALDPFSNLYITGWYRDEIDFGVKRLTSEDYHQIPFVAKLNTQGKFQWINDKISETGNGVGRNIVCDSYGDVYITINTSYSFAFFTKIDQYGEMVWRHKMKRSARFQKLLIDQWNNLYLCGEGYGATFPSNGELSYSYQSGFFLAAYDSEGVLQWLKAGGGNYCKAISLYQNKVLAFGWFSGKINFKNKSVATGRNSFWTAQFDLENLQIMRE